MAGGGARNRSGPRPDPMSGASARKGLSYRTLDANGYQGKVPEFPLPDQSAREAEVWAEVWRTPQAIAWATESWRWRIVAMYVRVAVACEGTVDDEGTFVPASAASLAQVHRFADQVGLTPAGLKENGWQVGIPEAEAAAKAPDGGLGAVVELFRGASGE